MVRESPDPGVADTAPHRDGWCRRDRLAAARGGCDSTRAPNPGVYECHPGRGAAPARTVGSSHGGSTRAAGICRPTLSTCELPAAEQSSRAGAVTGVGVRQPRTAACMSLLQSLWGLSGNGTADVAGQAASRVEGWAATRSDERWVDKAITACQACGRSKALVWEARLGALTAAPLRSVASPCGWRLVAG